MWLSFHCSAWREALSCSHCLTWRDALSSSLCSSPCSTTQHGERLSSYCSAWSEALFFCSAWREALLLLLRHSAVLPSSACHSPPPSAQHGTRFSSSYCPGMALSSTYCSAFSSHCPAWRKVLFYCLIRCLQGPLLLLSVFIILQHVVQATLLFLLPVVGALLFYVEVLPGPCCIQPHITARDSDV